MLALTCSLLAWCVADLRPGEANLGRSSREPKLGAIDDAVVVIVPTKVLEIIVSQGRISSKNSGKAIANCEGGEHSELEEPL